MLIMFFACCFPVFGVFHYRYNLIACMKKLEIVENLLSDGAYASKTGLPFG